MRHSRNLITLGLVLHILVCASHVQAGWKLRWWDKKDDCPQQYCPPQSNGTQSQGYGQYAGTYCYYDECQPKQKKGKKHFCCCKGDMPDLLPIVRSVAANITNQQAVPIQQNEPGPIKMTVQQDDGAGQQADRPSGPSLDSRVDALEEELAKTSQLLLEISRQMQAAN